MDDAVSAHTAGQPLLAEVLISRGDNPEMREWVESLGRKAGLYIQHPLEQFRKIRRLFEGINGGLFFRKTPLGRLLPIYTISESAKIAGALQEQLS